MLKKLRAMLEHPWMNFTVATILIGTGLSEGWDSMTDNLQNLTLKSHHGVIVFGFVNMLKSIPDILMGLEKAVERQFGGKTNA